MFLLSLFAPHGLIPARFLRLSVPTSLLLCLILRAGLALAMDGSLAFTSGSPSRVSMVAAEAFGPSLHPDSESTDFSSVFSCGVVETSAADRAEAHRIIEALLGKLRKGLTGLTETEHAGIDVFSKANRASLLKSGKGSPPGYPGKGRSVLLFERGAVAPCSRATGAGAENADESIDVSLWNPERSPGDASSFNHDLQSLISDKLFLLETDITGNSAQVKIGFKEPVTRDAVRCASTFRNCEKRYACDPDMHPDRRSHRSSCVSLSFQIAF